MPEKFEKKGLCSILVFSSFERLLASEKTCVVLSPAECKSRSLNARSLMQSWTP